jgi:phage terminase large subunit
MFAIRKLRKPTKWCYFLKSGGCMALEIKFDKNLINRKFRFLLDPKYDRPLTIMKGGSSSSKSYSISQVIPMWILQGRNIIVARESGDTIRRTIFLGIRKAISRQGLDHLFTIRVTHMTIQSRVSQGCAVFVATSDEEKMKSLEPASSAKAFDTCIMEEASEISFASQMQLMLRMRGKSKFKKRTYMLLNPISREHHIFKKYYAHLDDPDSTGYIDDRIHLHHSTYLDNAYLDQSEIDVLNSMKDISPRHYDVYALGKWGTMSHTIYSNWEAREIPPEEIAGLPIRIGLDFGYIDATACNFMAYDKSNSTLYIFDEIHLEKSNSDNLLDALNLKFAEHGLYGEQILYDWADPRYGEIIRESGFRAEKGWKGAGSILAGINFLQTLKIVIDKRKCPHTAAEISCFSWKEKDGNPIDDPKMGNDHHMDSMRMGMSAEIKGSAPVRWGTKKKLFGLR